MKAVKDNKVYNVDETNKGTYLAAGFDIVGDDGSVIERSASSTVSRKAYDALLDKYNALLAEKAAAQPKKKGKSGGEPDVSGSK
ncbi:MAG: hypothetical protein IJ723_03350 [Ruminococcus sp.]|nr:hypothetical protein [Ruminococcus sp.]